MAETKLGTGTFLRRSGLSAPVMRGLEAAGVIKPSRSDTGWRQFSEADLQAAARWMAEKATGKRP